jgi:hypothetical protein
MINTRPFNQQDSSVKRAVTVKTLLCTEYHYSLAPSVRPKLATSCASSRNPKIKNYGSVSFFTIIEFLYRAPTDPAPCLEACMYGCNIRGNIVEE